MEWRKVVSVALLAYAAMPCFAQAFALVFFHQVNLGSISKLLFDYILWNQIGICQCILYSLAVGKDKIDRIWGRSV